MHRVNQERCRGFTLLEVAVAVSLITAMCIGVATLFAASARGLAGARSGTVGTLLVREKLEELRALPFDDPVLVPTGVDTLHTDLGGYYDVPVPGLRRRWAVAPLPTFPTIGIVLEVDVFTEQGQPVARAVCIRTRQAV